MVKYFSIDVITTCAEDYITWKNVFPSGIDKLNGVTVRRFLNDYQRGFKFRLLNSLYCRGFTLNMQLQEAWMRAQGPYSSALIHYIKENRNKYDLFVFFTYLYCPTYFGLPLVYDRSVLIPTAHDEKPIYLDIFNKIFSLPVFLIFLSEEEKEFTGRHFKINAEKYPVIGSGIDFQFDESELNIKYDLKKPYIIYAGRVDPGKGCNMLFDFFARYKETFNNDLQLILIGQKHMDIPVRNDIKYLGFVSEKEKWQYMKAASAFVLPSKFESLSMAALEAMACGVPVLANGESEVLKGHCRRSGGGICFSTWDGFADGLNYLLSNEIARREMGSKGQFYVQTNYNWPVVEQKFVSVFMDLIEKQRAGQLNVNRN
jgi:glycosyltransferase involved in cell wall biosynthesis